MQEIAIYATKPKEYVSKFLEEYGEEYGLKEHADELSREVENNLMSKLYRSDIRSVVETKEDVTVGAGDASNKKSGGDYSDVLKKMDEMNENVKKLNENVEKVVKHLESITGT